MAVRLQRVAHDEWMEPHRAGWWDRSWIGLCLTWLILASQTKFVLRDPTSVAGRVDLYIVAEVAAYLLVATYVVLRRLDRPGFEEAHWLELVLFGYVWVMAISIPFSPSPTYAAVRVLEAATVLLVLACAVLQPDRAWFRSFVDWFVVATAILVVVGVVAPSVRGPLQQERFNWLATHPVVVGEFLALALALSGVLAVAAQWREGAPRRRVAYWGGAALFACALVFNNTRGSAAAAGAGLLVGVALILPARLRASAVLTVAFGATMVALTSSSAVLAWVARGESAQSLESLNARVPYWSLQLHRLLHDNPLFGFGVGASRSIFVDETGLGGSHNAALNVLVDMGIVGLAVWLTLVVGATVMMLRRKGNSHDRVDRALWLTAITVLLVNGITTEGLGAVANVGGIWLMVLVTYAAQAARSEPARSAETDCAIAMA